MQEWIGYIAATVIGGTILLLLAVMGWRGQHHNTSATQYSAAKEGMLDFARVIEEDFNNLGAGLTNNTILEISATAGTDDYAGAFYTGGTAAFDTSSATRRVHFCAWTDRTAAINPLVDVCDDVEYRWTATGTTQVRTEAGPYLTVPTYTVERYVGGTKVSESIDTITRLRFELFNALGNPTSTLADVRSLRIEVRAVSPLGGGTGFRDEGDAALRYEVDQTRWSRHIQPLNLTRVPTS